MKVIVAGWRAVLGAGALLWAFAAPAAAQSPAPAATNPVPPAFSAPRRPRIGLVLGGGGAKGFAHIGVIKDLEARHIPIDAIAGTSMGAVVGSMYAIGNDAAGIDRIAHGIDWQDVFNDRLQRRDLAFRRKSEDRQILLPYRLGLDNGKPVLPTGVLGGQKLYATVQQLTAAWAATSDFNALPIPYRAVATDIATGRAVPMGSGSLSTAVFASMAIPAAFPPIERDGLLLVDGGISDNLPVKVARAMGVDIVIVVDVGEPPAPAAKITNALAVFNQMQLLLGYDAIRSQRASLTARDVLIEPDIDGLSVAGFDKLDLGITRGVEAAARQAAKLDALRVSDADWAAYLAERAVRARPVPIAIARVVVDNDSKIPTRDIAVLVAGNAGKPLDGSRVADDVASIYALDAFERVDYRIDGGPDDHILRINARGSRSDRRYFQAGLILASDFGKTSTFDLGIGYTDRDFLGTGAEWRGFARIGNDLLFDVSLYRQSGRAFVEPTAFYSRASSLVQRVGSDDGTQTFQLARAGAGVDGGMVFGNWGELRAGVRVGGLDRSASSAGFSVPPGWSTDIDYRVGFTIDTLDSVAFPRDGLFATVQFIDHVGALGGEFRREQLLANVVKPMTRGRATLILGGRFGFTGGAVDEVPGDYRLGGFLNLSGLPRNALVGQQLLFGRAVGYYRISDQSPILDLPVYVGGSLEAGNVWTRSGDVSLGNLRTAASGFVGFDSPLGPIFLAYGRSSSQGSVYLVIGRLF